MINTRKYLEEQVMKKRIKNKSIESFETSEQEYIKEYIKSFELP